MKKLVLSTIIMMEMCMWTNCMGMTCYAHISDMFSISRAKLYSV